MDLSTASNWVNIYEDTLRDSSLDNFILPIENNYQAVAVYVTTSKQKPTWHRGGWINQLVQTNLINDSEWSVYSQTLLLGGNVVIFPNNFPSYSLRFSFPNYFSDAFLRVDGYSGEIDSNGESVFGEVAKVINDVSSLTSNLAQIAEQVQTVIQVVGVIRAIVGG